MLTAFSNSELTPIIEAYRRMLNEGYLTDTVTKNTSPEIEAVIAKVLERYGFEMRKDADGYRLHLDGKLFSLCSTLGDIFGSFNTFMNIYQKFYKMEDNDDIDEWNRYLGKNDMKLVPVDDGSKLCLYNTQGNILRTFDGIDDFIKFSQYCTYIYTSLRNAISSNIPNYGSDKREYMEKQKTWTRTHGSLSKEMMRRSNRESYSRHRDEILAKHAKNNLEKRLETISNTKDPIKKLMLTIKNENMLLRKTMQSKPDDMEKLLHRIVSSIWFRCKGANLPQYAANAVAAMCNNRVLRGLPYKDVYDAFFSNGFSLPHAISAFTGKSVDEVDKEFGNTAHDKIDSHNQTAPKNAHPLDVMHQIELPQMPMNDMRKLCDDFFGKRNGYDSSVFNPYSELYRIQKSNPNLYVKFLKFLDEKGYMG